MIHIELNLHNHEMITNMMKSKRCLFSRLSAIILLSYLCILLSCNPFHVFSLLKNEKQYKQNQKIVEEQIKLITELNDKISSLNLDLQLQIMQIVLLPEYGGLRIIYRSPDMEKAFDFENELAEKIRTEDSSLVRIFNGELSDSSRNIYVVDFILSRFVPAYNEDRK